MHQRTKNIFNSEVSLSEAPPEGGWTRGTQSKAFSRIWWSTSLQPPLVLDICVCFLGFEPWPDSSSHHLEINAISMLMILIWYCDVETSSISTWSSWGAGMNSPVAMNWNTTARTRVPAERALRAMEVMGPRAFPFQNGQTGLSTVGTSPGEDGRSLQALIAHFLQHLTWRAAANRAVIRALIYLSWN